MIDSKIDTPAFVAYKLRKAGVSMSSIGASSTGRRGEGVARLVLPENKNINHARDGELAIATWCLSSDQSP